MLFPCICFFLAIHNFHNSKSKEHRLALDVGDAVNIISHCDVKDEAGEYSLLISFPTLLIYNKLGNVDTPYSLLRSVASWIITH